MILSDRTLREAIASGRLGVDPFDDSMIQPSSLDVRIDSGFRVFRNHTAPVIDVKQDMRSLTELVDIPPDGVFILHPGEFVLGSTLEYLTMPTDLVGRVEGKALGVGTPIPTPHGWATIDSLRVGDHVYGLHGRPVRVKDVSEVLLGRPCFEIEFSDGATIVADAAHQWLVSSARHHEIGGDLSVATTATLAASARRGHTHHVPVAGPIECPAHPLPVDPYHFGRWLAGAAQASDPSIAAVPAALNTLGVAGTKHIPSPYLRASIDQRGELLRGLLDRDSCPEQPTCATFVTTEQRLAENVHELAASLGLRPVLTKQALAPGDVDEGPAFEVVIDPEQSLWAITSSPAPSEPFAPQRWRTITAIRTISSIPVRCIEVDAADGVFLAGRSFIPTHNSSLGRLGLLIHQTAGFIDPGFEGHITLELANVASLPITIYPAMKIGQISFMTMTTPADRPYGDGATGSKYRGQRGPTPSRYFENFND